MSPMESLGSNRGSNGQGKVILSDCAGAVSNASGFRTNSLPANFTVHASQSQRGNPVTSLGEGGPRYELVGGQGPDIS